MLKKLLFSSKVVGSVGYTSQKNYFCFFLVEKYLMYQFEYMTRLWKCTLYTFL